MRRLSHFFLLALSLSTAIPTFAAGSDALSACELALWHQDRYDFSPAALPTLANHRLTQLAYDLAQKGVDLAFVFPSGENPNQELDFARHSLGENIQARALRRILERYFPSALFFDEYDRTPPTHQAVRIEEIVDSAERGVSLRSLPEHFEMTLLKRASPFIFRVSRESAREALGFPSTHRIYSIYAGQASIYRKRSWRLPHYGLQELLSNTEQAKLPETIFLSAFGGATPITDDEETAAKKFGYTITSINSSTTFPLKLDPAKKYLIKNNTVGKMHDLYAASDVAIVRGPVNFFEPLHAGTPVILTIPTDLLDLYTQEGLDPMRRTALKTGGVFEAVRDEDISAIADDLIKNPRTFTHPSLVSIDQSASALTQLLDQLDALIRKSLDSAFQMKSKRKP